MGLSVWIEVIVKMKKSRGKSGLGSGAWRVRAGVNEELKLL